MTPEEFERFRHDAIHLLKDLNEECARRYKISTWPRWDYQLDAGTLVFSEGEIPKVIASIQVVGTTSKASKTWRWAWANTSLPSHVKEKAREVQQFGKIEGLNRLTEPQLPDDEHLGWEMTSIMARIIGAKGAYRCPDDNGFIYFVYTDLNFADSKTVESIKPLSDKEIKCNVHGVGQQAFICGHLLTNPRQKWVSDVPTENNPWPDAWCAKCDEIYRKLGEWTDENSAQLQIKLLCHRCYELHRKQEMV